MTPAALCDAAREVGVTVLIADAAGNLRFRPPGVLVGALRAELLASKPELVAILKGDAASLAAISPTCSECGRRARVSVVGADGSRRCSACLEKAASRRIVSGGWGVAPETTPVAGRPAAPVAESCRKRGGAAWPL